MIHMHRKFMHSYVLFIAGHRFLSQDKQDGVPSPLDKLLQKVIKTSPKSTSLLLIPFQNPYHQGFFTLKDVQQTPEKMFNTTNHSVQFSSVAQLCLTLCYPMNCSTPVLPVYHQLPEFTQTHALRVGDAIQPPHPLSSPSLPAPNPSQHQGLFQ